MGFRGGGVKWTSPSWFSSTPTGIGLIFVKSTLTIEVIVQFWLMSWSVKIGKGTCITLPYLNTKGKIMRHVDLTVLSIFQKAVTFDHNLNH